MGVDNIDVSEATKQGIMVMNTPNGNTVSTAQLAISLLVSMARKVPAANMSIKEGNWDRKSFTGVEIHDKVIGIVGCGRIGQVVAGCGAALGMKVIGFDPVASVEAMAAVGIKKVDLDEIFKVLPIDFNSMPPSFRYHYLIYNFIISMDLMIIAILQL